MVIDPMTRFLVMVISAATPGMAPQNQRTNIFDYRNTHQEAPKGRAILRLYRRLRAYCRTRSPARVREAQFKGTINDRFMKAARCTPASLLFESCACLRICNIAPCSLMLLQCPTRSAGEDIVRFE